MKNIDFRNGQPLVMMVSQYDYGYDLQVALWSNGEPVTITAAEIVSENFTVTCTFSGNVVTIPVTTSMTERFGHFPAELRVTDSTGQISSKNFDWFVERSPLAVKSTQTYSGDIVEFTAKSVPLNSVVVTMEPIQDLNGYSSPWPAGGGKNLLPLTTSGIEAANPTRTWTNHSTTINGITISIIEDANGNVDSIKLNGTATGNVQFFLTQSLSLTGNFILNGGVNGSVSVAVYGKGGSTGSDRAYTDDGTTRRAWIYVANGYTANNLSVKPMIRLATDTDPTFEPYSNICPITGRTGASVVVSGKNVLKSVPQDHTQSGVGVVVNDDGTIDLSGTATSTSTIAIMNFEYETTTSNAQNIGKKCLPNGKYKLSVGNSNNAFRLQVLGSNNASGTSGAVTLFSANNGEITIDDTYAYNWVRLYVANGTNCSGITLYPMIRQASIEDDTYEPYKGATTYPITFTSAGTVYAGTVDLVSGRLEVTHGGYTFTGDETFSGQTPTTYISLNTSQFPNPMKSGAWYADEATLCSHFPKVAGNTEFGVRFGANSTYFYFYKMSEMGFTTFADFKTWLASAGVQITYPLETPLTYTLTPTQVMSLLGENVVWSPDGEVTVVVPEFYS